MLGIDLGSRSVKILQVRGGREVRRGLYDTIAFYRAHGLSREGELRFHPAEAGWEEAGAMVATGYGKITVRVAGAVHIPEIQAHVLGACASTGLQSFTLLDIGGQDTKVVQVRRGQVKDFLTNDRCAASSGRYLEHMAEILGISVEELGRYDERPVELNATCAIFGETEIIGKIIAGASTEELAAGVNYAVFRRCAPMLRRLPSEVVVMAGGGALNPALARIVSRELGVETVALADPQFNGARGCCAYGRDMGWS